MEGHAIGFMQGLEMLAEGLAHLLDEGQGSGGDHVHRQALLAQGGGGFQADEAGADDHHAAFFRQIGQDGGRVGAGPQQVDALELGTGHVKGPGFAAGGEHAAVVVQGLAVGEFQLADLGIQARHLDVQAFDALLAEEVGLAQRWSFIGGLVALEDEFGQGGPVIGFTRFAADQQQAAAKAEFSQGRRYGGARGARTDDDEQAIVGLGLRRLRGQGLGPDQHLAVAHVHRIALQGIQRRWFAEVAIVDGETRLVPGTDQAALADRALGQRAPAWGALRLEGTYLVTDAQQQDCGAFDLDRGTAVFAQVGKVRDRVHGFHGGLRRRLGALSNQAQQIRESAAAPGSAQGAGGNG